jgi:alkaline phosphatase D
VASSIPVLSEADEGETWRKWPLERKRLMRMLDRAGGTLIASGDSHFGAHYEARDGRARPIHELTSSSLNFPMSSDAHRPPGPLDPARIGAVYYPANFGAVEIDWTAGTVSLVLYDNAGGVVSVRNAALAGSL